MLKKVVVLFPLSKGTLGEKTFEGQERLRVDNTDAGYLIIKEDDFEGKTYAVFKDWIYWVRVDEKDDEHEPAEDCLDEFYPEKDAEKRVIEKRPK